MDLYFNSVQQNVPIISEAQLEPLKQVEFQTAKNNSIKGYVYKKNLYTANDGDFLSFFEKLTKRKRDEILEELKLNSDWTNSDRLKNRLLIMDKFKKDIKTSKSEKNIMPKRIQKKVEKSTSNTIELTEIKFTVKKDIYTATDEEFTKFLMIATKSSKERVLKGIKELNLQARTVLVNRFKKSVSSALEKGITI